MCVLMTGSKYEWGLGEGSYFLLVTRPHKALLEKLTSIGLNKYLIKWVASYLTGRKQQVVVYGSCLNFSPIISGVLQGPC